MAQHTAVSWRIVVADSHPTPADIDMTITVAATHCLTISEIRVLAETASATFKNTLFTLY